MKLVPHAAKLATAEKTNRTQNILEHEGRSEPLVPRHFQRILGTPEKEMFAENWLWIHSKTNKLTNSGHQK
jgi:hypothetical protein